MIFVQDSIKMHYADENIWLTQKMMAALYDVDVQFYELYKDNEKVSPLVTQLSWTNHLKIMSACKSMDERIFHMNMCIKERLSKRELERQIDSGYYERYMLSQKPLTPVIEESRRATGNVFLDNYVLDFLDVPEPVSERDLQKSIRLEDFWSNA